MPLIANSQGNYRFLPGISPYSSGVIANDGFEIVHATLERPVPWHAGLLGVRQYLADQDRGQHALCGVELRCPRPHTLQGFIEFNTQYRSLLTEWEMMVDGVNPVARTNVAPVVNPPSETVLFGFSYTRPSAATRPTFVVAGGGELLDGGLDRRLIVRSGETSEDAMLEKTRRVVEIMSGRLDGLGATNDLLSTIDVYSSHPVQQGLAEVILPGLPAAAQLGVRWFYSRPPIEDIEFEMDMRGVVHDIVVAM